MRTIGAKFILLLSALLILASCQSIPPQRQPADVTRDQSLQNKNSDEIAVYLDGQQVKYIQAPVQGFNIDSLNSIDEIAQLLKYIEAQKTLLEVNPTTNLTLRLRTLQKRGSRSVLRFQQVIERQVNSKKYTIPIETSSLVATFNGDRLESLNSQLKNPPSISLIFNHPGFNTSGFSEKQMEKLISAIRNSSNEPQIRSYLATIAKNSNIAFDFDKFLAATTTKQLQMMRIFFLQMKALSTAKLIIDLAQKEKLSLIQHGTQWMFQVSQFLDLPIQFDIAIPGPNESTQRLKVKNLRDLYRTLEVQVYSQNNFPGGERDLRIRWPTNNSQPTTFASTQTTDIESSRLFQNVTHYFRSQYNWIGFNGTDENTTVTIVKDITTSPWAENAFWYKEGNFLGIGGGGDSLMNLSSSVSTLAHEYTHAIIDNSSAIAYRGQSGAINEHLADIEGISAEAFIKNQPFDYTIGEDILTPLIKEPQKDVIIEKLKQAGNSLAEIEKYSMGEVALRNIYAPQVSIFQQLSTMQEVNAEYGLDCEPSVDNDNCGVHYAAGVPSRAISLIIGRLGFEKTRKMIFNTMIFRLGSNPTFQEYLRQLHEECLITPTLNPEQDCPIILSSFQSVGITYPLENNNNPKVTTVGPLPIPISPLPQIHCGRILMTKYGNYKLVDNTADALIILPLNAARFNNHFTKAGTKDYGILKPMACVCMKAQLDRTQDQIGTWVTYFSQILTQTLFLQNSSVCSKIDLQ